jgi:1-acyl-sn-glycerol-3-phosphate acyltransferase
MKQDIKTKLINRKIKKPNPILMSIGMWCIGVLNRFYKVKFTYDYDVESIKNQPTILLSTHASRLEFIYTVYGFKRHDINVVCGFQNILKKGLYHLFIQLGVISKYLYQPDFMCVKNMLRVLRSGGAIGLFPEGIQSTSGSTHPINPATTHFLKSCKANVVVCTTKGAYLATNRYSGDRKKGYISANYSLLFTPDMLSQLSEEEIYKLLLEKFRYNDFEYNKTARNKYIGKKPNAFGINKILYKCPDCKEEHTLYVENDTIACKSCGFSVRVDEYYDLVDLKGSKCPEDIDQWYKWQRRCVAQQIKDDDFKMSLGGNLYTLKYDKLRKSPHDRKLLSSGEISLTNKELSFIGTLEGERVDFNFSARSIYSLTFSTKGFLEFYHNNDYFIFIPNNADQCLIKWTLAAEEIHNLYDEKWRSACEDVYEYSKGDNL